MITYSPTIPDEKAYFQLFETTGWNLTYRQTAGALGRALERSWFMVCAQDRDQLVGAGRVLSDGVQYAVLFDIIVVPTHQGMGIGSEIVRRLIARCDEADIRDILLFAARGTVEFYARHGFEQRPEDAPGMLLRRMRER